ncbi:DEAD/DEAH box helicase [Pseudoglutamicibacter albus]|uniref:DEAD/DEAH box helicase n=1 Tax=Pseudoglutamicibacter albus TaxID=98671 RepID=UPI001EF704C3|nr:DEAD/DEAH box helicase [Pseudoglutamicibacter albus]
MSSEVEGLSPAERFQAAAARQRRNRNEVGRFTSQFSFDLDEFQLTACDALEAGRDVLVAAPTGAGKTIVGEFAVHLALARGTKAFYTTPIKALSNQKFSDFAHTYGAHNVGLLTGDTSINSEAPVVVMTTEVLRNMLYAGSTTLEGLEYVVMDEVHYLADKDRGAVWEEVILHLPQRVQVVSLSATVSNAEEFGGWLNSVRGATDVVVTEHRPVPLSQHVLVGKQLVDLFAEDVSFEETAGVDQLVNPHLLRLAQQQNSRGGLRDWRAPRGSRSHGRNERERRGRNRRGGRGRQGGRAKRSKEFKEDARRYSRGESYSAHRAEGSAHARIGHEQHEEHHLVPAKAQRPDVVMTLKKTHLLPAIVFIFSRKQCDLAVQQCINAGLRLTDQHEQRIIRAELDEVAQNLPAEDLDVLGYWQLREGLLRGIAAHHAGMVPVFKEAVERLFVRGVVKVVYATETLALGINMPARSVVLEKLDKFNGETHVPITPGEYTQLTGRAGRRGIDVEGHAVVTWHRGMEPGEVAGLASKRTYPLNSSFRPTYNMSLNLVRRLGAPKAREVLERSFAQYQADASVVGLARQLDSREESLDGYAEAMQCHLGDFKEYAQLRAELSAAEKAASSGRNRARKSAIEMSLESLVRGDIVEVGGRRGLGVVVVTQPSPSLRDPRPFVVTMEGASRRLSVNDLDAPVEVVARVKVPKSFKGASPKERIELARRARNAAANRSPKHRPRTVGFTFPGQQDANERIEELRAKLKDHPCHQCPDREQHARWAERYQRLKRETDRLHGEIQARTNSIARTFDRVLHVLEEVGYVKGRGQDARVTDAGTVMLRMYGERDLLTCLVANTGLFSGLSPAAMAAAATMFVFMPKRDADVVPHVWPTGVRPIWDEAVSIAEELSHLEKKHHIEPTPAPDCSLVQPMHSWATGEDLADALFASPIEAGDFVRWAKQTIDFLGQVASNEAIAPDVCASAAAAADLISRGIVEASSVVEEALEEKETHD